MVAASVSEHRTLFVTCSTMVRFEFCTVEAWGRWSELRLIRSIFKGLLALFGVTGYRMYISVSMLNALNECRDVNLNKWLSWMALWEGHFTFQHNTDPKHSSKSTKYIFAMVQLKPWLKSNWKSVKRQNKDSCAQGTPSLLKKPGAFLQRSGKQNCHIKTCKVRGLLPQKDWML